MKLKKRIRRQSFDYKAESDYYKEAAVCPNCGNREEFKSLKKYLKAVCNNERSIIELRLMDGGRSYTCKKCGCQWDVAEFK